jgi:mannan endo-1,4-beta-mannosidase
MKYFSGDISRRELLKAGIGFGAALSGFGTFPGCAATGVHKKIHAPVQDGERRTIVPPENGCLVGFYKKNIPSSSISHYKNALGSNPTLFVLWSHIASGFPTVEAETIVGHGTIPYIALYPGMERSSIRYEPEDIVKGRCDSSLKSFADDAADFGKKYGGFFVTALPEPNAHWWPWSLKPDTAPAIRHIWQIFDDRGANQYATWGWEAFCRTRYEKLVRDPELYYPGDKYIDWIGMNVFANLKNTLVLEDTVLRELLSPTYEQMLNNHPQKPLMVSEFGRTPGEKQPSWLMDAYRSIKKDFPKIKAAIYYDNITATLSGRHTPQDHTLDEVSLSTLKNIFHDPYWIMVK